MPIFGVKNIVKGPEEFVAVLGCEMHCVGGNFNFESHQGIKKLGREISGSSLTACYRFLGMLAQKQARLLWALKRKATYLGNPSG